MAVSVILRPDQVSLRWDDIAALLRLVEPYTHGEMDADDVLEAVDRGEMFIAALMDNDGTMLFVAACELMHFPKFRALHVTMIAGRDMKSHLEHQKVLEDAARKLGATRIQALCRPAQARLFERVAGFRPLYTMIGKEVSQ